MVYCRWNCVSCWILTSYIDEGGLPNMTNVRAAFLAVHNGLHVYECFMSNWVATPKNVSYICTDYISVRIVSLLLNTTPCPGECTHFRSSFVSTKSWCGAACLAEWLRNLEVMVGSVLAEADRSKLCLHLQKVSKKEQNDTHLLRLIFRNIRLSSFESCVRRFTSDSGKAR